MIVSDIKRKAYFCPHWLPFQTKPKKTISFELQKNESLNVRAVTSLQSITLQIDTQYQPLPKSKIIHIPLANHDTLRIFVVLSASYNHYYIVNLCRDILFKIFLCLRIFGKIYSLAFK